MKYLGKYISGSLFGCLIAVVLNSCATTNQPDNLQTTAYIQGLTGLNNTNLTTGGNCAITEFDIPGQGLRIKGGVGGLAVVNSVYPDMTDPVTIAEPAVAAQDIADLALAGSVSQDVAILVVDDFGGNGKLGVAPVYTLGEGVFGLSSYPFSSSLNTRLSELDTEMNNLINARQISHGAMVFNHINSLILDSGAYGVIRNDAATKGEVEFTGFVGQRVLVKAVDTEEFDTSLIRNQTHFALDVLQDLGFTKVAINMSFSVVPCRVKNDFAANRSTYPTFQDYAEALLSANPGTSLADIYETISTPVDNATDPLYQFIVGKNNEGFTSPTKDFIFVAASGNFGLEYSMYPAAWPQVISASSSDMDSYLVGTNRSSFSNWGEVMHSGAWFTLTDPEGINGGFGVNPEIIYAGTSFAAPSVSVFSAFDLALDAPKCNTYTDIDGDYNYEPALANYPEYTSFNDMSLADAITDAAGCY